MSLIDYKRTCGAEVASLQQDQTLTGHWTQGTQESFHIICVEKPLIKWRDKIPDTNSPNKLTCSPYTLDDLADALNWEISLHVRHSAA